MFAPFAAWLRRQRIPFAEGASIAPHLYFKIGGTVSLLVPGLEPARLAEAVPRLIADKLPYLVIGGGSNLVFSDGLTRAAVLVVPAPPADSEDAVRILGDGIVQVGAGMRIQPFLAWCTARGAAGLEFLSGIPGTLGGAAVVNAGAFGRSLSDVLLGADILDAEGRRRAVDAGDFAFRYRESRYKHGRETLLSLRLKFAPGEEGAIAKKIRENLEYRLKRHPSYRLASAGCFFKNPVVDGAKASAGKIIEECGLKQVAVGGLVVAREHANFLVNRGRGSFADLRRLEEKIRETVAARTGILLEREVIYVSPDGEKY
jgi:UDP-N-acetylmuramate dehydrogenase